VTQAVSLPPPGTPDRPLRVASVEETRAHLAAIVEHAEDAILSATLDGTISSWNRGAERLYGWTADEAIGQSIAMTFPPDQRANVLARLAVIARGEAILGLEAERVTRDGHRIQVVVSLAPIRDDAGRVTGASAIARNIGERLADQAKIAFQVQLLDAVEAGVMATDLEGRVIYWNRHAETLFGYSAAEALGVDAGQLLGGPGGRTANSGMFASIRETGRAGGEVTLIAKDGRAVPVFASNSLIRNEDGQPVAVVGVAVDVSLQRMAEEALARSESLLAAAEQIANLGSYQVDLATGRVHWSAQLRRMAQVVDDALDLTYERFLEIVHPEDRDRVRATIEEAIGRAADHAYEFRVPRPDGSERVLSCQARIVTDADGHPLRIQGTAQDITDTRRLEREARESQKMEAVGRLAGGIAHDFNNALTAILGYSQILRDSLAGGPEAEWAEQIEGAARHAAGLTRQLLAFSRRQVLQPKVLDVGQLVDELVPMIRRLIGEDIELIATAEPGAGNVRVDPGQLQQALINLAVNARDAMPHGGTLTISVANADAAAHAAGTAAGPHVSLRVADSGEGMDEATKTRIFEPFFTTKEVGKGTGLGLAMVHGFVTQSGGQISFESEPGRGTRFTILLPQIDQAVERPAVAPAESAPARASGLILLVEDEPRVRELTRLTLLGRGYEVIEATNAVEAIHELDRTLGIDLVISDVVMPGSGGGELAQAMKTRRYGIPIIFISGYPRDAVVAKGISEMEFRYLAKPFTPAQLLAMVLETLKEDWATPAAVRRRRSRPRGAPPRRAAPPPTVAVP